MPWRETPAVIARARDERAVLVNGPQGKLVGIFTPAAPEASPAGVCVVFVARPRFEQRRVSVEMARRLAVEGFCCFRFDQHGWGDSEGELSPAAPDEPVHDEILAVIRYLKTEMGQTKFALWGLCRDARTALSAFRKEASAIDGLAFLSAPVSRLASPKVFGWKNMARWTLERERWRELIFSRSTRREAVRAVRFGLRGLATKRDSLAAEFKSDFRLLVRSNARALFLYGTEDGEYQSFRLAERDLFPKLDAQTKARFEVAIWLGGVHSVVDMARQREIVEKSLSWISSLHRRHKNDNSAVQVVQAKTAALHPEA